MSHSTGPGVQDYALLIILAAIWGASFMFIKIAVETIPPMTITAGRILLAAIILYLAMRLAGQRRPKGKSVWLLLTGSAFFGNTLPFTLIGWGEIYVESALAAILMAIMPLSTLILAHFFTDDEPLTRRKVIGIIIGFTGVLLLIGPSALKQMGDELMAQLSIFGGAICYSISTIFNKKLGQMPGRTVAAWVMILSSLMIVPASLVFDQPWKLQPDSTAILSVICLGLFATALCMLILLKIVREQGASFLSMNNYMVPVFGIIWGAVFLAERPHFENALALILILAGVAISKSRLSSKIPKR